MDGMSEDGHLHEDKHDEAHADDLTTQAYPLDLAAVRRKLQDKSGKQYWRTLEELAEDPHFEDLLHREFPRQASEWDESVDRRDFLKLMGASLALAGMVGCGRPDVEKIVPYVKQPDGIQARPFQNDLHFVIVAMRILALPFVPAQGVPGRKSLVNGNLKH